MKKQVTSESIETIRAEIDTIDRDVLQLLGRRFNLVKAIVRFKSNSREVIAKKRYDEVIAKRRELATENGLNPDVIEKIYRTLMDHFIEEEMRLLENKNNQR